MIVNHIDKTYVTSDAATILKEVHPVLFSSKLPIPPPSYSSLLAKCRRKSVEMPPTLWSPSPENCLATLRT